MIDYNINTQIGRRIFIDNYKTGQYSGIDEHGNDFEIHLTQDVGMVKTVIMPDREVVIEYNWNGEEISKRTL